MHYFSGTIKPNLGGSWLVSRVCVGLFDVWAVAEPQLTERVGWVGGAGRASKLINPPFEVVSSHRIERAQDPSPSMPGRTAQPSKAGGLRIT